MAYGQQTAFEEFTLIQCSKFKNIPGCPCFKSRATKLANLVALINAWLPIGNPLRLNAHRAEQSHGVGA